jgi:crossover junction endodeoxyribonuclease RuvC
VSFRNGSGPEATATVFEARKNLGIGNAAPSKPPPRPSPILGVDPGITGGIAFLFANRVVAEDIPTAGGEVDVDTLVRRVREMQPTLAIIERANAMPKQGVASTFKYGVAYGALRTVVALCNIPYRLVTPGKWKNYFGLDSDKEKSRALAIQFWPGCGCFSLKKDHGRAEAALIARYGAETCPQANRGACL